MSIEIAAPPEPTAAVSTPVARSGSPSSAFTASGPDTLRDALRAASRGLEIDAARLLHAVLGSAAPGADPAALEELATRVAADLIIEAPDHGRVAARLLARRIQRELAGQGIARFRDAVAAGVAAGLVGDRLRDLVAAHGDVLDAAIAHDRDDRFEYFGLRTVHDRYLLRHPTSNAPLESPQHFFLRVACAVSADVDEALVLYRLFSELEYLPSSPTLFNAGTRHEQLSSCFLLDSPDDDLAAIYGRYADIAQLSKYAGGIGVAWHRVRARGARITSTNGRSNGIVPWLKTLDASVAAVNQGGKRKGACCVYLEPWHADIEAFLELRDSTGDEAARTHNLNLAHWIPDLFMRRVETDGTWSLFDPATVPSLPDLWGDDFERAYQGAEAAGLAAKVVRARDLYGRMMRTLAQTGNGWMTFKDACNRACNQTAEPGRVVHSSNLCTEIVEVTGGGETAVCNLGSINLARHLVAGAAGLELDVDKLAFTVRVAVRQLDQVIDRTFYPIASAATSNRRWRPVGLGVMGLADVFYQLGLPFDVPEARALSRRIAEEIAFAALTASAELAAERGAHPAFAETRAARGQLHVDHWQLALTEPARWDALRARIREVGLRNSLLIAIAPTATIASIAGCAEGIEPQVSNLFRRETLSGDFLQVNRYLVAACQRLGLWTDALRARLKLADGSVQGLDELPAALRAVFRTAWELPMRAVIDMAAERTPFIDQSQSLNLFVESPSVGALSAMYFHAWKQGLKTTYYLRSRPATRIAKTTVTAPATAEVAPAAAVACSLENPETCEACQ